MLDEIGDRQLFQRVFWPFFGLWSTLDGRPARRSNDSQLQHSRKIVARGPVLDQLPRVAGNAACGPSEVPFVEGSDGLRCTINPRNTHLVALVLSSARTALAPGSDWHSLPGNRLQAKLSGGVKSLRDLGEILGGQLYAA